MTGFDHFNLPDAIKQSLKRMNFTIPTAIQAQAIPLGLEGRDVLGSAQTGTGKTIAFAIPLVAKLLASPRGSALVLTPTRELAVQVIDVIQQLVGPYSALKTALLIGGESMPKQLEQLRARPRIFVGTPGRINDHLARGSLMLHDTNLLVLDETDRMLDMGFGVQIDRILKYVPQTRQTLMFSATLPQAIVKMSERYLRNPERIAVGASNTTVSQVSLETLHVAQGDKYTELLKQLDQRQGTVIVFVRTKHGAERLADRLCRQKYSADAIHGDLLQKKRDRVIAAFREKKHRIMVATDIAARGLDIPHIEHVINFDLPQCPEDYIHRIGRTARAGAEGSAISFIAPEEKDKWRAIARMLNPDARLENFPAGEQRGGSGNGSNGGKKRRPFRGGRGRPGGHTPRAMASAGA